MIIGVTGGQTAGLANWHLTDASTGRQAPFVGGGTAALLVFLVAGFSFQGTESVGLAAAEARNPHHSVPRAIRGVFWRILLFYIAAIFLVGTLIPFTDPNLLRGDESIAYSPFTIVFQRVPHVGAYAANAMNFVILSSVLSCGNSSLYVSSRMLYAMAHSGKAPRLFGHVNSRGVPVLAVCATGVVGALAFLSSVVGQQKIYQLLYNASGLSGFLIWLGIALSHLRFRRAWIAQGRPLSDLKFRAPFYPYAPWLAIVLFLVVLFGANAGVFWEPQFSWYEFFSSYATLLAFLVLFIGYKLIKRTRLVPLQQCNLDSEEPEV
jgi:lysine-specific permease